MINRLQSQGENDGKDESVGRDFKIEVRQTVEENRRHRGQSAESQSFKLRMTSLNPSPEGFIKNPPEGEGQKAEPDDAKFA